MLWAEQYAWLRTPEEKDGPTRGEKLRRAERPQPLPDDAEIAFMTEVLVSAGPSMPNGWSDAPLTATELEAWCRLSGEELTSFEALSVLDASRAFVAAQGRFMNENTPSPLDMVENPEKVRQKASEQMRQAMEALAQGQKRG